MNSFQGQGRTGYSLFSVVQACSQLHIPSWFLHACIPFMLSLRLTEFTQCRLVRGEKKISDSLILYFSSVFRFGIVFGNRYVIKLRDKLTKYVTTFGR